MPIVFIVVGIIGVIYGVPRLLGLIRTDIAHDSKMDKTLISDRNRYFIGRYLSGAKFIIAGVGAIALGVILHLAA